MARSEIEQDVRGLSDHELSGFQERRGGGRPAAARLHHSHHRGHAALAARDIGIIGAGLFQRETDIFTAALNAGPVIEFIAHGDSFEDAYGPAVAEPCFFESRNASRGS